ncbi:hypothetical protein [Aureimonas leprariae]|uniref:Uncharacterized protein n=1 Tax=Plantimonas leprariae TaxID=2615207 RepID=A0A7V7PPZ3_9HYPH|nr:hypothetical protein [Aureimonas leprariae]KAB0680152.1 hypothetical protein F6X38_08150 [Aureimonas leprariae]
MMFRFVPPKYLEIRAAVRKLTIALYGDEFAGRGLIPENAERLMLHMTAMALMDIAAEQRRTVRSGDNSHPFVYPTAEERQYALSMNAAEEALGKHSLLSDRYREAWWQLRGFLSDEAVKAAVMLDDGKLYALQADAWNAPRADAVHLHGLMPMKVGMNGYDGLAVVERASFAALLSDGTGVAEPPKDATRKPGKGGRPRNSAWLDAAAWTVFNVHEEGLPEGPEELIRRIMEYTSEVGGGDGGMARATIQPFVDSIFKKMRPEPMPEIDRD